MEEDSLLAHPTRDRAKIPHTRRLPTRGHLMAVVSSPFALNVTSLNVNSLLGKGWNDTYDSMYFFFSDEILCLKTDSIKNNLGANSKDFFQLSRSDQ